MNDLPEEFDMEELMYRLYVLDKVVKGQKDIKQGVFISVGGLRREIVR